MATFVLVHGAWHGAWCWHKLSAELRSRGHTVVAPDLPGHGIDRTPASEVTLASYAARVADVLDEQSAPVVLVGHSMGGIVISQAAERRPEKVRALVYLAAFLLPDGAALLQHAEAAGESRVLAHLAPTAEGTAMHFELAAIRDVFYHDCDAPDIALAETLLVAQPLAPLGTPVSVSEARWGSVPRYYIEATGDQAIAIAVQRGMQAALPCKRVFTMSTSHSPFFSRQFELADHLEQTL